VPDERVVVHERLEHLEQRRADDARVLREPFLVDDAERRGPRGRSERVAAVARRRPDGTDQGLAAAIASVVSTPLSGKPPPNALPMVTMSGSAPECPVPQYFPVRPKPVIISSAMKSAPSSWAMSRTMGRNSSGGTMFPAVPCIGSTMTRRDLPGALRLHLLPRDLRARDAARRIREPDGQR
jgi:hypothetical protein